MLPSSLFAALGTVGMVAAIPQMNPGVKYMVSNPSPAAAAANRSYGFRGKYFEVETDLIKSQYSQVKWHPVPDVPIPADVVAAFDGKVMMVTGWEVDVLRNTSKGPEPVPCYESYNHHYSSYLSGKGTEVSVRMPRPDDPTPSMTHGGPQFVFTDNGRGSGQWPSAQHFAEHNGNEARQSYHYVASGYGVPIESPTTFSFCPMQINTRNPDGSGSRCNGNCPLPRRQNAWKNASWAGILECPCTTRKVKTFDHRMFTGGTGCTWNSTVTDEAECFASAAQESKGANAIKQNSTISSATKPYGCSVEGTTALYNTEASSTADCSGTSCVCRAMTGWIDGNRFTGGCMDEPLSDLIKTHNPTCDINLYDGGLSCCGNDVFLLDHDQPIPPLEDAIYYKWRFYYEELAPEPQKETFHVEWQFGKIEYSVPKAPEGTPAEKAVHTLTTRFSMHNFLGSQCSGAPQCTDWAKNDRPVELIMAGFHCHSPGCLGGKLYNADTGEELCHVTPQAGTGLAAWNEENYLWLPPCQWGSAAEGLTAPPVLPVGTNLTSIKWTNSSVAHSGVMAIWQGRAAYAD